MLTNEVTPAWLPERDRSYLIYGFTGQGQQRPDMLEAWYGYSVETDAILRHFHSVTNTEFGRRLDEQELERGPLMQPANVTLGVIGSMALAQIEITPNEAAGHSLGEYAAVSATGFVDPEEIITLARHRGESTEQNIRQLLEEKIPTGMMAVSKKAGNVVAELTEILRDLRIPERELGIKNYNTDDQVVLSGVSSFFPSIKDRAAKSLRTIELKVDGPYHSLHMRLAKAAMKPHVDALPIRQPKRPKLYSPTTVGQLKTRDNIADMLLDQLVSPVKYSQLIEARLKYLNRPHIAKLLGARGAKEVVFVEIGAYAPGKPSDSGVLIGLNKKNVESYQHGDMPIRFHRVSIPEDLLNIRLTAKA